MGRKQDIMWNASKFSNSGTATLSEDIMRDYAPSIFAP
jgi:hypothetical protein